MAKIDHGRFRRQRVVEREISDTYEEALIASLHAPTRAEKRERAEKIIAAATVAVRKIPPGVRREADLHRPAVYEMRCPICEHSGKVTISPARAVRARFRCSSCGERLTIFDNAKPVPRKRRRPQS